MGQRPSSAVSLFTAVGAGVALVVGVVGLILGWVPPYFVVAYVVLAGIVAFNVWAARGSGRQ